MHPPDEQTFAALINDLMVSRNLSQRQMAVLLKVSDSQVSRWRRGHGGISLESLERFADVFGLDRGFLVSLAGLGDNASASTVAGVDPAMAALVDAERKETHDELIGIDPKYWSIVLQAGRVARAAAAQIARMASQPQPINTTFAVDISNAAPSSDKPKRGRSTKRDGDLTSSFPPAGDREQFANSLVLAVATT